MIIFWMFYPLMLWHLQWSVQPQYTITTEQLQPASTGLTLQGNPDSMDILQPAMGYNTLNQPYTGELEVR